MQRRSPVYQLDYEGCDGMRKFDARAELRRWFDNWKVDPIDAKFADDHECLRIEKKKFQAAHRCGVRYVATIWDVRERSLRRMVVFEIDAPSPPSFHLPANSKSEPNEKPMRDSGTITADAILEALDKLNLPPQRRYDLLSRVHRPSDLMSLIVHEKYKQELEQRKLRFSHMTWTTPILASDRLVAGLDLAGGAMSAAVIVKPEPPPKKHRRNQ